MSTARLGFPSDVRRALEARLPRQGGVHAPVVRVKPRDGEFRRCPVYESVVFEVQAFYVPRTGLEDLACPEEALAEVAFVTT